MIPEVQIQPSAGALWVLESLAAAGYEGFLVGGCVRDSLLGRIPGDWDVTTDATPPETEAALTGAKLVETGIRHGTVTAIRNGEPVEVTTYRVDGAYSDYRRPDAVSFTRRLEDDLARRDFTVNALAWSPKAGLIDLFSGLDDLQNRIIRCVGKPDARFGEDALRILRALRFASVLGFIIEPATAAAVRQNRGLLENVSAERVCAELSKLLPGSHAAGVLREFPEVFLQLLPVCLPNADLIARLPAELISRLAGLFAVPGDASAALEHLRFDRAAVRAVTELVAHLGDPVPAGRADIRRLLNRLGLEQARRLFALWAAQGGAVMEAAALLEDVLAAGDCWSLEALAVDGGDLLAAGVPTGPAIGIALRGLLDAVIEGRCPNSYAALLEQLSFMKESC